MDDYTKLLESEKPGERLKGLSALANAELADEDKVAAVRKLKEMILDWDDGVRAKVSEVLSKITGK